MQFFRLFFFRFLYRVGAGHKLLEKNRRQQKIPILFFHRVTPEHDAIWPGLSPRLFEKIILLLKKHYTVLPLRDLQRPGANLKNACFITFDDGYNDYLEYAYPILEKHNIPSTLFVVPEDLSERGYLWTSLIICLVKHYSVSEIKNFFSGHEQTISLNERMTGFQLNLIITNHLNGLVQQLRAPILQALRQQLMQDKFLPGKELLNFEELKRLDQALVDIGSHSLTHPCLQHETDTAFIEREIAESKKMIEANLQREVPLFAFPFAPHNAIALRAAKAQYSLGFSGMNELVDLVRLKSDKDYAYTLPRFNIHHSSAEEVFFLINGFHRRVSGKG